MATVATRLRKGMAIKVKGDSGVLLNVEHRTPGKGAGFMQVQMRSFNSGKTKDIRFMASEKVEIIITNRIKLEFSYSAGKTYFFMNPETYETVELPDHIVSDVADMLTENLACEVLFVEDRPISIDLPPAIELKVIEASEGLKGDTANKPTKAVTLETGKVIQVPLFIKQGELIRIDSRSGKYLGRK